MRFRYLLLRILAQGEGAATQQDRALHRRTTQSCLFRVTSPVLFVPADTIAMWKSPPPALRLVAGTRRGPVDQASALAPAKRLLMDL